MIYSKSIKWQNNSCKSEREGLQDSIYTCYDVWIGESDTDKTNESELEVKLKMLRFSSAASKGQLGFSGLETRLERQGRDVWTCAVE